MLRRLSFLLLVLCAFTALARVRAASHPQVRPEGGTVSGTVSRVQGNLIEIASGAVVIDATGAKVMVGRGREGTIADVKPGMQLFAAMRASNPSSHGALPATMISVTDPADVTLTGVVQSVDSANRRFVVLNETIETDANTSFGGYRRETGTSLADVQPNVVVHVQADHVNGRLVAREVLVVAPAQPQIGHVRGTVKSIGTDSWTIENEKKETITVTVNAQTKIAGSPKVGDTVEVIYHVDSAHNFVAVSIVKFERPDPARLVQFTGRVKSIAGSEWTVTTDQGDKRFIVNERTKVMPGITPGDHVSVHAVQNNDGTLTALMVMKLRL